ncbi:VirK/YbjX family protein [Pantoea sp. Aalb]|uniref:VirK/YbjX family protein n=1 Tax=Pantoea sp. Aalb TaxID=2576762 RepID=UPI00132AD060|nr:VirK/YbjX family protein [Pantoea sp. Aalb]MXP67642.1 DUF535 domain-containing protein [Pantoea sp. Aalb]
MSISLKKYPINNKELISFFLSLVSGQFRPNNSWDKRKFRIKFALRSLVFPVTTFHYLSQLVKITDFPKLLTIQGLLPAKLHRPYLRTGFSTAQRAQAIIDHYTSLDQLDSLVLRKLMQNYNDTPLASFTGKNNTSFLVICCPASFDREGEITLILLYEKLLVASLSFSIIQENKQKTLLIGGLQGPRHVTSINTIRDATKAMYGIFPKRLLVEVAYILAELCNIKKIAAVSDRTHVFYSLRYRYSKKHKFFASYNEFWISLGGKTRKDNMFDLPTYIKRKNTQEIVSKKRSEYRRRSILLDNLIEQIYQTACVKRNILHNL